MAAAVWPRTRSATAFASIRRPTETTAAAAITSAGGPIAASMASASWRRAPRSGSARASAAAVVKPAASTASAKTGRSARAKSARVAASLAVRPIAGLTRRTAGPRSAPASTTLLDTSARRAIRRPGDLTSPAPPNRSERSRASPARRTDSAIRRMEKHAWTENDSISSRRDFAAAG
jgi:hypothetical protein